MNCLVDVLHLVSGTGCGSSNEMIVLVVVVVVVVVQGNHIPGNLETSISQDFVSELKENSVDGLFINDDTSALNEL